VNGNVLTVPSVAEIASRLMPAEVTFQLGAQRLRRSLREWVGEDRADARRRRETDSDRRVFVRFAAALLERNVSGGSYMKRLELFQRRLGDPQSPGQQSRRPPYFEGQLLCASDLTEEQAYVLLREAGYRFPSNGAKTLVAICRHLTASDFCWPGYFAEAEAKWETGFPDDPLFRIKGIGNKVRDFALSEFSDYYCAPDLHVCRMMARTGLILQGYGDPDFSTVEYGFVRRVVQKLAKQTGFPGGRDPLSPAHIDRMFWYYGQDTNRCGADPACDQCPANDVCLTGRTRDRGGSPP